MRDLAIRTTTFVRAARRFLYGAALLLPCAASAQTWAGQMLGANEVSPVTTPATGFTTVTINGNTLSVSVSWSGLIGGPASMGHIHCCTAVGSNIGVAVGYTGFPAASTGTYFGTFNLLDPSIYTLNFLNAFGGGTALGARTALINGLNAGQAYSNIHNAQFGGGEIRANLTTVPEPASVALVAAGLAGVGIAARRRSARS